MPTLTDPPCDLERPERAVERGLDPETGDHVGEGGVVGLLPAAPPVEARREVERGDRAPRDAVSVLAGEEQDTCGVLGGFAGKGRIRKHDEYGRQAEDWESDS